MSLIMKEEKTINDALLDIQAKLKAPKGQTNNFGNYKYRSAEDILEAVKPLLKDNGCFLTISDDIVMVGSRIYVKATITLSKNGETIQTTAFARESESKSGMDASQITGAASSYARKYALNGLFCIDDTKEADALNTNKEYMQPPTDPNLELILANIKATRNLDELSKIWHECSAYQPNPIFSGAVSARKKELQSQ